MRKLMLLVAGVGALMLHAGDLILMQKVLGRYISGKSSSHELSPDCTSIKLAGQGDYTGYKYLIAKIQIDPVVLAGKTLSLEVRAGNYVSGDSFYVKCLNKEGKIVASFMTRSNLSGGWNTMVCTPGKDGGGVVNIPRDIAGDINSEVVALQIYCGRQGPAADFDVEIRNISVENSLDRSAVEIPVQSAAGAIGVLKVSNIVIPGAQATGVLADGAVTLKGEVKYQKRYDYLVARIYVRPFVLENNALTLKVTALNFVRGDQFYVKCLDKDGKNICTFYTRADLTSGVTLTGIPGRNNGVMLYSDREAKVPMSTPVAVLQIYCGRPGPAPQEPIEVKIEDLQLVAQP